MRATPDDSSHARTLSYDPAGTLEAGLAAHQYSGCSFELDLVAQRDPVGAHHGDLRLEAGPAAINGTAMHPHQAEAAALVEAQRIDVVVGSDDPQAGTPLPPGQLRGRTFIASP
jgi:hypothetical protein